MKDPNDLPPNTDAPDHRSDNGELPPLVCRGGTQPLPWPPASHVHDGKALFDSITPNTHVDLAALDAWAKNNPPGMRKMRLDHISLQEIGDTPETRIDDEPFDPVDPEIRKIIGDVRAAIDALETNTAKMLRPPICEPRAVDASADPVKRWPFAESPGDLANRLWGAYCGKHSGACILPALRTVLIEQPPRLAPWLDPGAAAKDSKRLYLMEAALRHAFPNFFAEGPIEPEVILATGDEHRRNLEKLRAADQKAKGLPVVKVRGKVGGMWFTVDGLKWRDDGVLEVKIDADREIDEPSSPLVRDDLSMRLKAFLVCETDLNAHDRSLIEEAAGELALTPKPKRSSGAQREAAFEAIRDGLLATNVRAGVVAAMISHNEYARIASAVADAVVGAEQ